MNPFATRVLATRAFDAHAAGGLAGSRLALTLALSLGVHAGAAMWLPAPGGPARATSPTTLDVRLVGAATRPTLAAAQPPRILPAVSTAVLETPDPPRSVATLAPQRLAALRSEHSPARPVSPRAARRTVPTPVAASRVPVTAAESPVSSPASPSRRVERAASAAPPSSARAVPPARPDSQRTASAPVAAAPAAVRSSAPSVPVPASGSPGVDRAVSATPSSAARAAPRARSQPQRAAAEPAAPSPLDVPARRPPRPAAGNPAPSYPVAARRRGQEGRVLLRLEVSRDGVPSTVRVVSSSGVASLDRAARDAVSRWRFTPASRGGRAEAATVDVPVEFRLDGRG